MSKSVRVSGTKNISTKNIIVCSDGTGNTINKGRGTNVFKLFEAIDKSGCSPGAPRQFAIYDDGVGTAQFHPIRLLGGAFGLGLARNVRQLYRELSRAYEPGDRIYLFGFSRGAFTVRTLSGLVTTCGLVNVRNPQSTKRLFGVLNPGSEWWLRWVTWRAWSTYRRSYQSLLERSLSRLLRRDSAGAKSKAYRRNYTRDAGDDSQLPWIHFVGVWDTVGAVAIPFNGLRIFLNNFVYRFSFPNKILPPRVEKACHALSIDEERHAFSPVLWDESDDSTVGPCRCGSPARGDDDAASHESKRREEEPRCEQVWFPGVHSNVGGGYPKQGISLVALHWMLVKAEKHGLTFNSQARDYIEQHRNVQDFLYDSRRGPSLYYFYMPRDIQKLVTKHQPVRSNFWDGCIGELCYLCKRWIESRSLVAAHRTRAVLRVHASTFDRIRVGTRGYAPGPIPSSLRVVDTPGENRPDLADLQHRVNKNPQRPQRKWVWVRKGLQMALYLITALAVHQAAQHTGGYANLAAEVWKNVDDPIVLLNAAWNDDRVAVLVVVLSLALTWIGSRVARAKIRAAQARYWRNTL